MTGFFVGIEGGLEPLSEHVGVGFFAPGNNYCPSAPVAFAPCSFDLAPGERYPAQIAMIGARDANNTNEKIPIEAYMFGEIAEGDRGFTAYVVDTDALNVVADNWYLRLSAAEPSELHVRLTLRPADTVTVQVELGIGAPGVTLSPTTLQYGPTDYDVPQNVMVSGTLSGWGEIVLAPSNGMPWGSVRLSPPAGIPSL